MVGSKQKAKQRPVVIRHGLRAIRHLKQKAASVSQAILLLLSHVLTAIRLGTSVANGNTALGWTNDRALEAAVPFGSMLEMLRERRRSREGATFSAPHGDNQCHRIWPIHNARMVLQNYFLAAFVCCCPPSDHHCSHG